MRPSGVMGSFCVAALSLLAGAAVLGPARAGAATMTWVGKVSTNWADTNWSGTDNPPLSGDALWFTSSALSGDVLNNNLTGATTNVAGITFDASAPAFTMGGNAFTLTGNLANSSTNLQTINMPFSVASTQTVKMTANGGNFLLGGVISGAGGLTTSGTGILTLGGSNTYTGAATIGTGGTLQIGSGGLLGSGTYAGQISLGASGAFVYGGSAAQTLSGLISGAGGLVQSGSGVLTLTVSSPNNFTYTGPTTINSGLLLINATSASAAGSFLPTSGYAISAGGTLQLASNDSTSTRINAGVCSITGAGMFLRTGTAGISYEISTSPVTFNQSAGGLADFEGGNNGQFAFATTNSGSLTIDNSYTQTSVGDVHCDALNGNGIGGAADKLVLGSGTNTLYVGDAGGSGTFAGNIQNGNVVKQGAGTEFFSAANSYSSTTTVSGGVLQAATPTSLGSGPVTVNGGTLSLGANAILSNKIVTAANAANGFAVNGAGGLLGNISGPGGLKVSGNGVLTIAGTNSYQGATVVSSGTLLLQGNAPLPSGTKIMPVGDSITYGTNGTNAGYRGFLYSDLTAAGSSFQFVGTTNGNPGSLPTSPVNQTYHDGWSGWTTGDVLGTSQSGYNNGTSGNIGTWLTQLSGSGSAPNIITMMIGTNDLQVGGFTVSQGTSNLSGIIDTIHTEDPGAELLLATLTPRLDNSTYSSWNNSYNALLPGLVAQKKAAGDNVVLVDMNTNFPTNGLSSDNLHPNDTGYAWMASQWMEAILTGSSTAIPSTSPTTVAAGAALDLGGNAATIGPLSGAGNIALGDGALTVNSTTGNNTTFSGTISGAGTFTKFGPATLVLAGSDNTYGGGTYIDAGTLVVNNSGAVPNDSSLTVRPGGTFIFDPSVTAPSVSGATLGGASAQRMTGVEAVPEPGTLALFAAGGIVAAASAWRRRGLMNCREVR